MIPESITFSSFYSFARALPGYAWPLWTPSTEPAFGDRRDGIADPGVSLGVLHDQAGDADLEPWPDHPSRPAVGARGAEGRAGVTLRHHLVQVHRMPAPLHKSLSIPANQGLTLLAAAGPSSPVTTGQHALVGYGTVRLIEAVNGSLKWHHAAATNPGAPFVLAAVLRRDAGEDVYEIWLDGLLAAEYREPTVGKIEDALSQWVVGYVGLNRAEWHGDVFEVGEVTRDLTTSEIADYSSDARAFYLGGGAA